MAPSGLKLRGYGSAIEFLETTPERVVVEISYAGNGGKPPPHLHPSQEERFEVLEGEINVLLDGEPRVAAAGDTLVIPAGTLHQMWADAPARQRWETRPALRTERFFKTLWGMQQDGVLQGDPRRAKLQMALTMRHFRDEIRIERPSAAALAALSLVARVRGLRAEYEPR